MPYKPRGSFSAAMFDSISRAESLQAMVLDNIHDKFQTQAPTVEDITTLTWEAFIKELETAYADGSIDELNAKYAQLLAPFITMALTPQEGGQ